MKMTDIRQLRYGENPHQQAHVRRDGDYEGPTVLTDPLHGKPLSYNNILDADAAMRVLLDFADRPSVVVMKHKNPCGLGTGETLGDAFTAAWRGDAVSRYGSIVGYSQEVGEEDIAKTGKGFVEVVVAPSYTADALAWVRSKPNKVKMRLIATGPLEETKSFVGEHVIRGGVISQTSDNRLYDGTIDDLFGTATVIGRDEKENPQYSQGVATKRKFDVKMKGLVEFGVIASKHTGSNAIVIVYEHAPGQYMMLGMGAGQPNRLDSVVKLSLPKARENLVREFVRKNPGHLPAIGLDIKAAELHRRLEKGEGRHGFHEVEAYLHDTLSSDRVVLASDAFFPKPDGLEAAAMGNIKYVVQPGGSQGDESVIAAADLHRVAMMFTGVRHFRH